MIRFLSNFKKLVFILIARVLSGVIRLLPYRIVSEIQNRIQVTKKLDYGNYKININSEFEYGMRLNSAKAEPEMIKWLQEDLKDGDIMFDIGANVGTYSLIASSIKNNLKIYCFEPSFLNFYQLCRNIIINDLTNKIFPLNIALSNQNSIQEFKYQNLITGGAIHSLGQVNFESKLTQLMPSFTVDYLIRNEFILCPNVIKIDVDGHELAVLIGMKDTLKNSSLRSIYIEVDDSNEKDVYEILYECGFYLKQAFTYNKIFVRGRGI